MSKFSDYLGLLGIIEFINMGSDMNGDKKSQN